MSNSELGRWSSFAVFVVGLAYIVALVIGFATRGLSAPIVDPLLAVMEALTLIAALVFAAFTFQGSGRENRVKRGLLLCGMLCLVGTIGPAVGSMRLQLIGVFAYGGVLPIVSLALSRIFRDSHPVGAATSSFPRTT